MKQKISIKSYTFEFVIEPDRFPDGRKAYHAYIPELESIGGSTWGYTKEEAVKNIQEVTQMIVEESMKSKRPQILKTARVSSRPMVTVTA